MSAETDKILGAIGAVQKDITDMKVSAGQSETKIDGITERLDDGKYRFEKLDSRVSTNEKSILRIKTIGGTIAAVWSAITMYFKFKQGV